MRHKRFRVFGLSNERFGRVITLDRYLEKKSVRLFDLIQSSKTITYYLETNNFCLELRHHFLAAR